MHYSTSIGLDVHARSISASAFVWETGEVVSREFAYAPEEVAEWARSLPQPAGCLYESGPTGFDLKHRLDALGVPCHVGAVTKMVRPSGDRVKTDRRDARFLSRLLAVGEFVECWVPPAALEAARDLPRAREDARQDLMRARHQLSKLLLRHGLVWPRGRAAWTKGHRRWLRSIELPDPTAQLVLDDCIARVRGCEERRDRLDAAIARRAGEPDLAPTVRRLEFLRGVSLVTAFGLALNHALLVRNWCQVRPATICIWFGPGTPPPGAAIVAPRGAGRITCRGDCPVGGQLARFLARNSRYCGKFARVCTEVRLMRVRSGPLAAAGRLARFRSHVSAGRRAGKLIHFLIRPCSPEKGPHERDFLATASPRPASARLPCTGLRLSGEEEAPSPALPGRPYFDGGGTSDGAR